MITIRIWIFFPSRRPASQKDLAGLIFNHVLCLIGVQFFFMSINVV